MDKIEKHIQDWKDATLRMAEAMSNDDIDMADKAFDDAKDAFEKYKEEVTYRSDMMDSDAGEAFGTFESVLPELYLKGRKAIRESLKIIREDKNLKSQVLLQDTLKAYTSDLNARDYVTEALKAAKENIDVETIEESNKEFSKFLIRNNIRPKEENGSRKAMNEACGWLLCNDRTLQNMHQYESCLKTVCDYVTENASDKMNRENIVEMMDKFNSKFGTLNEDERSLVDDIIDAKKEVEDERKKNIFEKIRNECIESLKAKMAENNDESLNGIMEMLEKKQYNAESVIQDVAKLLEVGGMISEL